MLIVAEFLLTYHNAGAKELDVWDHCLVKWKKPADGCIKMYVEAANVLNQGYIGLGAIGRVSMDQIVGSNNE